MTAKLYLNSTPGNTYFADGLHYTAKSDEAHKFLVVVEDSFNTTPWEQTFEFNGKDSGDEGKIASPIVTPVNPAV